MPCLWWHMRLYGIRKGDGQGFYKKVKGDKGKSEILTLDLETMEYRQKKSAKFATLELTKSIDKVIERFPVLVGGKDKAAAFYRKSFGQLFAYVSHRIPEITDQLYKIDDAMEMLKIAYDSKSNDPYIIDSIGWAYFLIDEYEEAEKYLKRAVELMPDDPIVNDHYGDILWKLDQKIQARYFWNSVLRFDDTEDDMRENINKKLITGLKSIQ